MKSELFLQEHIDLIKYLKEDILPLYQKEYPALFARHSAIVEPVQMLISRMEHLREQGQQEVIDFNEEELQAIDAMLEAKTGDLMRPNLYFSIRNLDECNALRFDRQRANALFTYTQALLSELIENIETRILAQDRVGTFAKLKEYKDKILQLFLDTYFDKYLSKVHSDLVTDTVEVLTGKDRFKQSLPRL